MKIRGLLAVAAMIVLSACAGQELGKATRMTPEGTAFDKALSAGYLQLAKDEYAESDYADSDYFARRAMEAGSGQTVLPPEATDRDLPESDTLYVAAARNDLMAALDSDAGTRVPDKAAEAQVTYECWIQELEENFQPDHIAACRDRLDALIPELRAAPAPAAAAKPVKGALYKVYFASGSTGLDAAANAAVAEAAALARTIGGTVRIVVSGYTDTAGSAASNTRLSQRRAAAVAAALRTRGVAESAVRVKSYGERFPDVRTGDGVGEPKNRRVEISVAP